MKINSKEKPIGRIEHLALRFHPQVTHHPQTQASCILRRADIGRYTTIPLSDWTILSRLDGTKTIGDLLQERLEQGKGFGLLALVGRVIALRSKGFLIPEAEPVLSDRKLGQLVFGFRLPLPKKVSGTHKVWPWMGLLLLSFLSAILLFITGVFPKITISNTMFLAAWGSVAVVLSLRSIFSAGVLFQAGTRPWRVGVAWAWFVPFFFLDTRDVYVAGRKARTALAISELSSAPFVMAVIHGIYQNGFLPADIFLGGMMGTLITLWWMLRPFANGPIMELARGMTGKELIWQDAKAYLSRRLWQRAFERGDRLPSEGIFIVLSLIYPLWGYMGLALFGQALSRGLFPAMSVILSQGGESPIGAWILLGTLLTGVAIAVGGLCFLVRAWQEKRPGTTKSPLPDELVAITKILAEVPFFASFPPDTLLSIASESQIVLLPPRAFAVRQNAMGDQFFVIREGKMAVIRHYETGKEEKVAELLPGDTFGEMALLMNTPRTASVQALSPVQVISISRSAFEKVLAASSLRKEDVTGWLRISQQLRHSPLFVEMSANEVAYFLKRSHRRPIPSGEVLIQEGDVGSHFYMVLSGTLDVHQKGEKVGTLTTGDFVGEIALLAPIPRTATVTAVEHAQVLELSRNAFFETLSSNVFFGAKIIETAQERRNKR